MSAVYGCGDCGAAIGVECLDVCPTRTAVDIDVLMAEVDEVGFRWVREDDEVERCDSCAVRLAGNQAVTCVSHPRCDSCEDPGRNSCTSCADTRREYAVDMADDAAFEAARDERQVA